MLGSKSIEQIGYENGWPCICDSIWQMPVFCPSYGKSGCPYVSELDEECPYEDGGSGSDVLPFLLFFS